jgi:hypothetical protein
VSPRHGASSGGSTVTVTGTGLAEATAVNFGTVLARKVVDDTPTQITAVSPAGTGTVDITVTTAAGTSATGGSDHSPTSSRRGGRTALHGCDDSLPGEVYAKHQLAGAETAE